MSEVSKLISSAVAEREAVTAERCRNLSTNRIFTAEVEEVDPASVVSIGGDEIIPKVILHTSDRLASAEFTERGEGSMVEVEFPSGKTVFRVIKKEDNYSAPQAKLHCVDR